MVLSCELTIRMTQGEDRAKWGIFTVTRTSPCPLRRIESGNKGPPTNQYEVRYWGTLVPVSRGPRCRSYFAYKLSSAPYMGAGLDWYCGP